MKLKLDKEISGKQAAKDFLFYSEILHSEECQCGGEKRRGYAFCYSCYRRLSALQQRELYRKLGEGFEEAYDDALIVLSD